MLKNIDVDYYYYYFLWIFPWNFPEKSSFFCEDIFFPSGLVSQITYNLSKTHYIKEYMEKRKLNEEIYREYLLFSQSDFKFHVDFSAEFFKKSTITIFKEYIVFLSSFMSQLPTN
jgi:hypothetical protein